MYTRNLRAGGTVYADASFVSPKAEITRIEGTAAHYTTFHGSLKGTAEKAITADVTNSQNYADPDAGGGTGSAAGFSIITATATDPDNNIIATKKPTADSDTSTTMSMSSYLTKGNYGVEQVLIDEGDYIKNKINIGPNTGFITERPLTTKEIRVKLKDPANNTNREFINTLYAENRISEDYNKKIPTSINRSFDGEINYTPYENTGSGTTNSVLIKGSPQYQPILPDKKYDPMALDPRKGVYSVNLKTLLGVGIPLSTFLIGTTLGHLATIEERQSLARQLLLQAEVIKYKKLNNQFKDYQLVVAEGVYKATAGETLTPGSVPYLAQTGRAITYEMYNQNNISSPEVVFDFATRLATNLFGYDKIIIDYDEIDPNAGLEGATLNVQVIVVMPQIDENYDIVGAAKPELKLETRLNNQILSNTDLVEVNGLKYEDITLVADNESGTVIYDYSNTKTRNKPVKDRLINALAAAVKASGVDYVTITSGLQPGTTGRRIGSARHDSGLAADLFVTYKGRKLDASKIQDQAILALFVKAAVKAGIRAGGMSKGYMGNYTMHLDMLGAYAGKAGPTGQAPDDQVVSQGSRYNGNLVTWLSDSWFVNALKGSTT
jgi:hypothetical protein